MFIKPLSRTDIPVCPTADNLPAPFNFLIMGQAGNVCSTPFLLYHIYRTMILSYDKYVVVYDIHKLMSGEKNSGK